MRYLHILYILGTVIGTIFKDIWYLITYPHYNGFIAGIFTACITGVLYTYWVRISH